MSSLSLAIFLKSNRFLQNTYSEYHISQKQFYVVNHLYHLQGRSVELLNILYFFRKLYNAVYYWLSEQEMLYSLSFALFYVLECFYQVLLLLFGRVNQRFIFFMMLYERYRICAFSSLILILGLCFFYDLIEEGII
jgi:hypothetical protein